ncbi:MAG TPA: zf-HC2 domain-containing protein [Planctomycetota bacterium]|nr:zf-HC2 domain-containing protein [Planctomycetota bacterium]
MTMNCAEWEEKLNAELDGELSDADRAPLEAHLAACADCRRTRDAIRAQSAELENLRFDSKALEERIIAAVHAETAPRRGGFRSLTVLTAAAALIVVATLLFLPPDERATQIPRPAMVLESATGPVEWAYRDRWLPFAPGNAIDPGTTLRTTEAAKCEIACADGSLLRLDRATEVQFQEPRRIHLRKGQLFATVYAGRDPFRFTTEDGALQTDAGILDLSTRHPKAVTTLAVLAGEARIAERPAPPDNRCVNQKPIERSAMDPLLQTRWINDLLRLRDKNDPEVMQRVTGLLTRVGRSDFYESELRAFGERGAPGLLSILNRTPDSWDDVHRRNAARVLADVAGPHEVESLAKLLRDRDSDVRNAAQRGLVRITGVNLKEPEAWEAWFKGNQDVWACPKKE